MTRAALISLSIGAALFVALLAWQGIGPVAAALSAAGAGLVLVAAFHLLPVVIDAAAIRVLVDARRGVTMREATLARWAGESVNSLLPAGQIGGPVLMVRHLAQRGFAMPESAAVITVSTTLQSVAQIVFALLGLTVFAAHAAHGALGELRTPVLAASAGFAALLYGFYQAQRCGLFGKLSRAVSKLAASRDWSGLLDRADALDVAVHALYRRRRAIAASFALSLAGWIVGIGEVWLALKLIGHPVDWVDALLLESLGQAIRGAAFAIPGSLGVQEGGYLLLAPLVGLPADAALALSLAKRAREILLGVPGLVYLHFSERGWQRVRAPRMPAAD
jgi:putative membrane protein